MSESVQNLVSDLSSMDFKKNKDHNLVHAWSECVGKAFLRPFDLDEIDSTYCISGREHLTKKHSRTKYVNTACREPGMPFPIVVGCIHVAGDPRH